MLQASDPSTGTEEHTKFVLKGLELTNFESNIRASRPRNTEMKSFKTLSLPSQETAAQHLANYNEVLKILNSKEVPNHVDKHKQQAQLALLPGWTSLLSLQARNIMEDGIIDASSTDSNRMALIYSIVLQQLKAPASVIFQVGFKTGVYSFGPFNMELRRPFSVPVGTTTDPNPSSDSLLIELPSLVSPTGVTDLLIVREHVWSYVGGEIGAIQNVLKSEKLVRETK